MTYWLPVLGLALMPTAPLPKDATKVDPPSVVGEWLCESVTAHGRTDRPAGRAEALVWTFSADGEMVVRDGRTFSKSEYTTDAKKDPATIDWSPRGGRTPTLGIYKIEKDLLTLCYFMDGPPGAGKARPAGRPTAFDAPAGTQHVLMTFRRMEKKKD